MTVRLIIITLSWPLFGHFTMISPVTISSVMWQVTRWLYKEVILWLPCDRHLETLLFIHSKRYFVTSHQMTWFCCHLGTRYKTTIMVTAQWSLHMTVTRESQDDFLVNTASNLSQNNSHGDFSMEWPYDDDLRVIIRRMKDTTFQFNVVTVTLVTILDVTETSLRLDVLLRVVPVCYCRLYHFFSLTTRN